MELSIEQMEAELAELQKKCFKTDGSQKANASAQNLMRIEELNGLIKSAKSVDADPASESGDDESASESGDGKPAAVEEQTSTLPGIRDRMDQARDKREAQEAKAKEAAELADDEPEQPNPHLAGGGLPDKAERAEAESEPEPVTLESLAARLAIAEQEIEINTGCLKKNGLRRKTKFSDMRARSGKKQRS